MLRLWRDSRGAAALYIGLAAPILFGITAIAFDIGRLMSLQSELQSAADAAALAGAAELDRNKNSISRAKAAAGCPNGNNTVQGAFGTSYQTFATDNNGQSVTVTSCTFFNALTPPDPALLPPDTSTNGGTPAGGTTDDTQAKFIKVAVQTRSMANAFITMVGGPQIASTTATATAGFSQTICQTLPLFICNPLESCNGGEAFNPPAGEQIKVIAHSGTTSSPCAGGLSTKWAPGDYGFTNVPSGSGSQCKGKKGGRPGQIEQFLASDQSLGCLQTGVNPAQGDITKAAAGMNVRLDVYDTQTLGNGADSCYAPAPDVVAGMIPNPALTKDQACFPTSPSNDLTGQAKAFPFPHDTCLDNNNCTISRIGDGTWDITDYWKNNHGTTTLPNGLTASSTRYQVYQYELANNQVPIPGTPTAAHLENGLMASGNTTATQCFKGAPDSADRRLINVAVVDCQFQNVHGASQSDVPPINILQGFLTNCVGNSITNGKPGNCAYFSNGVAANNGDMYIEVVKVLQPNGSDGILHNVVQLYR